MTIKEALVLCMTVAGIVLGVLNISCTKPPEPQNTSTPANAQPRQDAKLCGDGLCPHEHVDWSAVERGHSLIDDAFLKLAAGEASEQVAAWLSQQEGTQIAEISDEMVLLHMEGAIPVMMPTPASLDEVRRARASLQRPEGGGAEVYVGQEDREASGDQKTVLFHNARLVNDLWRPEDYCAGRPIDIVGELYQGWVATAYRDVRDYEREGSSIAHGMGAQALPFERAENQGWKADTKKVMNDAGRPALELAAAAGDFQRYKHVAFLTPLGNFLQVFSIWDIITGYDDCWSESMKNTESESTRVVCKIAALNVALFSFGIVAAKVGAWHAVVATLIGLTMTALVDAVRKREAKNIKSPPPVPRFTSLPRAKRDFEKWLNLDAGQVIHISTNMFGRKHYNALGSGIEIRERDLKAFTTYLKNAGLNPTTALGELRMPPSQCSAHCMDDEVECTDEERNEAANRPLEILLKPEFFAWAYGQRPLENKIIILSAKNLLGASQNIAEALLTGTTSSVVITFQINESPTEAREIGIPHILSVSQFLTELMVAGGLSAQDAVSAFYKHEQAFWDMFEGLGSPPPRISFFESRAPREARRGSPDGGHHSSYAHVYARESVGLYWYKWDQIPLPERDDRIYPQSSDRHFPNLNLRTQADEFELTDRAHRIRSKQLHNQLKNLLVPHDTDSTKAWLQFFVKVDGLRDLKTEADGKKTPNMGEKDFPHVQQQLLDAMAFELSIDGQNVTKWQVKSVGGGDWNEDNTRTVEGEKLDGFLAAEAYAMMGNQEADTLTEIWREYHETKTDSDPEKRKAGFRDLWSYSFLIRAEIERPKSGRSFEEVVGTLHLPNGGTSQHTIERKRPNVIGQSIAVADDTVLAQYQFSRKAISAGKNTFGQASLIKSRPKERTLLYEKGLGATVGEQWTGLVEGTGPNGQPWKSLTVSEGHACGVDRSGLLFCTGSNAKGQIGKRDSPTYNPEPHQIRGRWSTVSAGHLHTCAIQADGSVWCFGGGHEDDDHQMGLLQRAVVAGEPVGAKSQWKGPYGTTGKSDFVQRGRGMLLGLTEGGTCGSQFGDGIQRIDGDCARDYGSSQPVRVQNLRGTFVQLDAGHYSTCAIEKEGSLWCWGSLASGYCENNSTCRDTRKRFIDEAQSIQDRREAVWKCLKDKKEMNVSTKPCDEKKKNERILEDAETLRKDAYTSLAGAWQIGKESNWRMVSVGPDSRCAVDTDGSISCWWHDWGPEPQKLHMPGGFVRCVQGDNLSDYEKGCQSAGPPERPLVFRSVAVNEELRPDVADSCAITEAGELWCFRLNPDPDAQRNATWRQYVIAKHSAPFLQVDVAADTACAIDGDDVVFCFSALRPKALHGKLFRSFETFQGAPLLLTTDGDWIGPGLSETTGRELVSGTHAEYPYDESQSIFGKLGIDGFPGPAILNTPENFNKQPKQTNSTGQPRRDAAPDNNNDGPRDNTSLDTWRLPLPGGTDVEVVAGYGPEAGSHHHRYTRQPDRNNDYYALDLAPISSAPTQVVAPADGVVVRAGWATGPWADYGRFVVLRHNDDGHTIYSTYAHLGSIEPSLEPGVPISLGQRLGIVGGSCDGLEICPEWTRPHLHWALHRDCTLGDSLGSGCYAGESIPPLPSAPTTGTTLTVAH